MDVKIDCSDLAGTYNLQEAKQLVAEIQRRIGVALTTSAQSEDNDLKYMGAMKKAIKEKNLTKLYNSTLLDDLIKIGCTVTTFKNGFTN
jgi:hypothetical protein